MKKKLLFVLTLFLIVILFLFFGNNGDISKDITAKGNSFIEGLKIIHKRDGNNIWTLVAQRADIIEEENKAKLTDITVMLEDKGMTIHAEDGLYDIEKRDINLNGRITAEAKDYTIAADSVKWDNSLSEIGTEGQVMIKSKKFTVEGSGMKANLEQKVRIFNDVKAIFYR